MGELNDDFVIGFVCQSRLSFNPRLINIISGDYEETCFFSTALLLLLDILSRFFFWLKVSSWRKERTTLDNNTLLLMKQ